MRPALKLWKQYSFSHFLILLEFSTIIRMDCSGTDEVQLSLTESFNSLQVSETDADKENGTRKVEHVLYNVEEWKTRKDAKEKTEAFEKIQQFKVKYVIRDFYKEFK